MLKLIGADGERFYSWSLLPGKYILGRTKECDFCVPDRTVSRRHAEIEVEENSETAHLTDLGSHNGCTVNGQRLEGTARIIAGDVIAFGQVEFKLTGNDAAVWPSSRGSTTQLAMTDPEKSVVMEISEALKPLPKKVSDIPELWSTLSEMARMLVLPEPKEVMLKRSLELVSRVIPAERLAVLSTSADHEEVYTDACLLPDDRDPGAFSLSRTVVKEILTNKSAILIGDSTSDPRFAEQQSIILSDMKSAMAAPLFDEGKVLGILYVDTTNRMHQYTDDYLRLLATFGNIIASRLVNYGLLQERHEKELYEAELRRASFIQKNLLVSKTPELDGYSVFPLQEQCQAVGGDLYDLALLPDGRLWFMVADVSGKGLGAALLMSNILASFRILYNEPDFELCKAIKRASLQLYNYSAPEDFATLFAGIADPRKHEITYVNAGHNPPILVRSTGDIETLDPSGTMIGAFDFSDWTPETVQMGPDDLLFVFSDGVTEASNGAELYGEDRTNEAVTRFRSGSSQEIAQKVFEGLMEYIGESPRSDDITMLFIKRNG